MTRLVDFLMIGAQKSGTTAIHRQLSNASGIQCAKIKEVHFFDNDSLNWRRPNYEIYHREFPPVDCSGDIFGEFTPSYMYWPAAAARIHAYNANIKLIVCLRDPVMRAFSHWRMETARNRESLSFSDSIRAGRNRLDREKHPSRDTCLRYSYVERGYYAIQLERIYALFPESQLLVLNFDDLQRNFGKEIERICHFLKVKPLKTIMKPAFIRPVDISSTPGEISVADGLYLRRIYRDDMLRLQTRFAFDSSRWLEIGGH